MNLRELISLARKTKREAKHPNIKKNGKVHFWSLSKQEYITSACQPKERTK